MHQPQEEASVVFERALTKMNDLLSAPDLVDEASTFLKMIIKVIRLLLKETAQHGIEAELVIAPGVLLPNSNQDIETSVEGISINC